MSYTFETVLFYSALTIFFIVVGLTLFAIVTDNRLTIEPTRNQNYACIYWVNDPDVVDARLKRHYEETGKDAVAITDLGTNVIYAHKPETEEDLMILGHEFLHVMWGAWHE